MLVAAARSGNHIVYLVSRRRGDGHAVKARGRGEACWWLPHDLHLERLAPEEAGDERESSFWLEGGHHVPG